MSLQPSEADFPRGGTKQKAKKRKLQKSEKDLFKTEDDDPNKRRKINTDNKKTDKQHIKNKEKPIQQNKKEVLDKKKKNVKQKEIDKGKPKAATLEKKEKKKSISDGNTKGSEKNKGEAQKKAKLGNDISVKSAGGNAKKKRRNRKKKPGNKRKEKVANERKERSGKVEKLYFAKVEVGMHILGCVAKVDEYSLTLDLPGGLQGEVSITAVSDSYTEQLKKLTSAAADGDDDEEDEDDDRGVAPLSAMFQPGLIFPCKVVAIKIRSGSKKKIFLSMNPSVINENLNISNIHEGQILSGTVTDCEDHGYVVDIGVKGATVFLSTKHAEKYINKINNGEPLHVGQVVRCQVLSIQNKLVKVGINPHKLEKTKLSGDVDLDNSTIMAGLQVVGTVKEVLKDGLSVEFNGNVGYIHRTHTTQYKHKKSFTPGEEVCGTVLYTLSNNSVIYLSLLPHLSGSSCHNIYESFSVLADKKTIHPVTALDALKKAVYFNMDGGLKALATLSNLLAVTDYKTPLHKMFRFGTKHSCTVIGFNLVEYVLLVRLQKVENDSQTDSEIDEDSSRTETSPKKGKVRNTTLQSESDEESTDEESVDTVVSKKRKLEAAAEVKTSKSDKKCKKSGGDSGKVEEVEVDWSVKKKKKKMKLDEEEEVLATESTKKMKKKKEETSEESENKELISSSKKLKKKGGQQEQKEEEEIISQTISSATKKKKSSQINEEEIQSQMASSKKKKKKLDDSDSGEESEELPQSANKKKKKEEETSGKKEKKKSSAQGKKSVEETDSGVDVNKMTDSDDDCDLKVQKVGFNPPRLSLSAGFSWSDDFVTPALPTSDDSSDDEPEPKKQSKKTGHEIRRERMEEEKAIFAYERKQLEGDQSPMTSDDFDRLVLQSPNSSMVWTRYMAYHLETVEIDKARAVAERALKTISFREEQEKLNMWVAYLNLENMYGGAEQLKAVFERAILQNEPIKVYRQMVQIYISSDKMEEAEKMYNTMCKKFSQDKTVWTGFAQFFFRNKRLEPARKLLQRCLKCLDKREHIEMISKFAQLEYKYGEAQRGCTMFENILTNYPKRTDLWSVYIDMVVKTGNMEDTRSLFERVIHMKMSSKKVQFFFKKYMDFEKKYGDAKSVEKVKQKAVDYVESQGFTETV